MNGEEKKITQAKLSGGAVNTVNSSTFDAIGILGIGFYHARYNGTCVIILINWIVRLCDYTGLLDVHYIYL